MLFVGWGRCALVILACSWQAAAAERGGTVTLLEGPAAIVRGVTRHALAEGVRLLPGDVVEVGVKGLMEIEFPDGAAFALAAGTRMLAMGTQRGKSTGDYYVTNGALKVSGLKQGEHVRFLTPFYALQAGEGSTVLAVERTGGAVFVESGDARVAEFPGTATSLRLKGGDFYTRKADQRGVVAARPSHAFIAQLPPLFLDPLPSRLARYKDREVQPRRIEDVSYGEVEDWLKAPLEIRRPLAQRFKPRLADPAFRSAVAGNLKYHPEWDPFLYPEKYRPRQPAGATVRPGDRKDPRYPVSQGASP